MNVRANFSSPVAERLGPFDFGVTPELNLGVVSRIGIYSTGAFAIDEIRIG